MCTSVSDKLCDCRYQEKFYFNPGDTGFQTFDTKFARIGVAICWDQWFPEAARCMALKGAEVTPQKPLDHLMHPHFRELHEASSAHIESVCKKCN
jgi:predicted amidohydrolase